MSLPVPTVDTRTFDDLVAEGLSLVPPAAPAWTDHNASDPGVTLVELLAWLSEQVLFQADRVSPVARRGFLRRIGIEPAPAKAARTIVALRRPAAAAAPRTLAAGFQVADRLGAATFQSRKRLAVSQAWLELEPREVPAAAGARRGVIVAGGADGADGIEVDQTTGEGFDPFGVEAVVGAELRLGFSELPATAGGELALQCWTASWPADGVEEQRIVSGGRGAGHYWARLVWEHLTADGTWAPLDAVRDDSRALTISGRVVVRWPQAPAFDPATGRFWLRARVAAGGFDRPPRLHAIAVNPLAVEHAVEAQPERAHRATGRAGFELELSSGPVVSGTVLVQMADEDGTEEGWVEVATWDHSGPQDPHVRLDPSTAILQFGDGRTGRVPRAGAQIAVAGYRVGGGTVGNLPAGRLVHADDAALTVLHPFAATGGAAAESLERALGRALARLERPARGVTLADLETIALATPGAPVGRAHAIPGRHPQTGCLPAAGVVMIVVLPSWGRAPVPSCELRREVRRALEPGRLLTTELHVAGPRYVDVVVHARLLVDANAAAGAGAAAVRALHAMLDPLTGGANGRGWPFGRAVGPSEVMACLQGVPGVRYALGVEILAGAGAVRTCSCVEMCADELPRSGDHQITVEVAR